MGQFALGNALYADQQPDNARKAFERATELDEKMGAAWLNLGLLLLQNDAPDAAREALTQAAALEGSWQEKARLALDSLNND